jgi:hypothetical protein
MARDHCLSSRGPLLCPPSACRWFPAIYGCARNHGETPSQVGLFVQRALLRCAIRAAMMRDLAASGQITSASSSKMVGSL